jgi:tRNA A37 threonylcarbamoyladenosine synthetase subunit TsaC/SUA5/YrdC
MCFLPQVAAALSLESVFALFYPSLQRVRLSTHYATHVRSTHVHQRTSIHAIACFQVRLIQEQVDALTDEELMSPLGLQRLSTSLQPSPSNTQVLNLSENNEGPDWHAAFHARQHIGVRMPFRNCCHSLVKDVRQRLVIHSWG